MKVRVFYRNRYGDLSNFEYDSNFKRINAKGIKEEAEHELRLKNTRNEYRKYNIYVEYLERLRDYE